MFAFTSSSDMARAVYPGVEGLMMGKFIARSNSGMQADEFYKKAELRQKIPDFVFLKNAAYICLHLTPFLFHDKSRLHLLCVLYRI